MTKSILLINGPNLNLLGTRDPAMYGSETLKDVEDKALATASAAGVNLECFQSNSEGAIIDAIQATRGKHDALVINPGGYSHTSVAIRDAITGVDIPCYEIHISDIHAREEFRHFSYITDISKNTVVGQGTKGYTISIEAAIADFESAS